MIYKEVWPNQKWEKKWENVLNIFLLILFLFFTTVFRRQKRDFGVSAAIGTAIAAISAGASVASATAAYQSLNHSVKMKMDVGK